MIDAFKFIVVAALVVFVLRLAAFVLIECFAPMRDAESEAESACGVVPLSRERRGTPDLHGRVPRETRRDHPSCRSLRVISSTDDAA